MAKLDELALTDKQRTEVESDLASGLGNVDLARKITGWGHPISEAAIRRYRETLGVGDPQRKILAGKIADLIEQSGIEADDIGKINRVNLWQAMSKDDNGDPVITDLVGVQLSPTWADGPEWPVVAPAPPITVKHTSRRRDRDDSWQTAVVLPDIQIGYFRDNHDNLHPTHDEDALAVALSIAADVHPDHVVLIGDNLDFPEISRFRLTPPFQRTTQATVDRAGLFAAELRAAVGPECRIDWLAGNHEERLPNYLLDNARAAFGLRQANTPVSWPVLSVPHLCRLDDHGIAYSPGWPAQEIWLNDRLRVIHGDKVSSNGSTAHRYLDSERVSTIYGHIHRREWAERTRHARSGPRTVLAASPGCLCRVDGAVPSTKGGTDLDGMPLTRYEDWQQGLAVVRFESGDGLFAYEQVAIHNGWAMYHDRHYGQVAA